MGFSKFFAKAAASLSAPSSSDKASIYLHTLKVECPVASEGSFLREAIQQVLVKMTTADATIRFVTSGKIYQQTGSGASYRKTNQ